MAKTDKREFAITPDECLAMLPEIPLEVSERAEDDFRQVDLRSSLLAIAELDQVSETSLVRRAVKNALGHLPEIEE